MQYKNITGFLKIRSKLKIDRRGIYNDGKMSAYVIRLRTENRRKRKAQKRLSKTKNQRPAKV